MSLSKLESFPNEIFLDLLENYINLIDVFVAFGNHLNNRFDALINQCKQFRLDLTNVRKKDFDHCIGSISTYRHKIESLFLSENIPAQISTFLLLFPTFDQFERLGELYLDFDGNVIDHGLLDTAMHSLSKTNIHTLAVKSTGGFGLFGARNIFQEFFRLSTLRRLVLDVNLRSFYWNLKNLTHCNVEHLTIKGAGCTWSTFKKILTCAKNLSYLNVRMTANVHSTYKSNSDEIFDIQPLKKLHTFIYYCTEPKGRMELHLLVECLCQMPNLRYLEISNADESFLDGNVWQMLFQTSLPLVTNFRLEIDKLFFKNLLANSEIMKSFQTPFWIAKKNFNIYKISCWYDSEGKSILRYYPIEITLDTNHGNDTLSLWKIPQRSTDNDYSVLSNITHLHLDSSFSISSTKCKMNNVKYLRIHHINSPLLNWMTMTIDFSKVKQLEIDNLEKNAHLLIPLLTAMEHLTSLSINFNQLINQDIEYIGQKQLLKRLKLSHQHSLRKEDILLIVKLFPSIEHFEINTKDLNNVPLLNTYLPNLVTLTCTIVDHISRSAEENDQWVAQFSTQVKFQFRCNWNQLTIWLDEDTFSDPFWNSFSNNPCDCNRSEKYGIVQRPTIITLSTPTRTPFSICPSIFSFIGSLGIDRFLR